MDDILFQLEREQQSGKSLSERDCHLFVKNTFASCRTNLLFSSEPLREIG
jgi:hypothetical protein